MRITLRTTPNTSIIPFDYQQKMVGVLHRWLGNNELHDKISLYSFSWLLGGKLIKGKGFDFPSGASFFISFYENDYLKKLIHIILTHPELFGGLTVLEIQFERQPVFEKDAQRFRLASPIFIKRQIEGRRGNYKFYLYDDPESSALMTDTLKHKMKEAGLPEDETLKIEFDLSYFRKRKKMVTLHGIKNIASMCPVIIHGHPESKLFAWTVGVGNATGVSFGALM